MSEAARQNEFLWLANWHSHMISQDVHVRTSDRLSRPRHAATWSIITHVVEHSTRLCGARSRSPN